MNPTRTKAALASFEAADPTDGLRAALEQVSAARTLLMSFVARLETQGQLPSVYVEAGRLLETVSLAEEQVTQAIECAIEFREVLS